jgi:biopolymer transport protein ExbD
MAFSLGGSNGGRGRFRGTSTLSDINIVPLVDVVLVLLVIFMLTAHVMEFGLEVDVPKVRQIKDSTKELPLITITKSGEISLNDKDVNINSLGADIRTRFPGAQGVYVRADKSAVWDVIAQVVSALEEAKIHPINMVTQPVDEADQRHARR